MEPERRLIELLHRNISLVLPCAILLFRLVVKWIAREEPKLLFKSILVFPLDLCFIAMGLVLAGLARTIPTFAAKYNSDKEADLAGALILVGLVLIGVLLTVMDRWARMLWQKFYTAWHQIGERRRQLRIRFLDDPPQANEVPAEFSVVGRMAWMFLYWSALVPLIFGEIALSVLALGGIIKRVL